MIQKNRFDRMIQKNRFNRTIQKNRFDRICPAEYKSPSERTIIHIIQMNTSVKNDAAELRWDIVVYSNINILSA